MQIKTRALRALLAAGIVVTAACDSFLEVENPNNLEAENVDAERDAAILSRSAYQSFVATYGDQLVYQAWFSNEAKVGDTFPTRNEFGRRDIALDSDQAGLWNSLHSAAMYARTTAGQIEGLGNTVDLTRAYFTAGYAYLMIGVEFCEGTVAKSTLEAGVPIPTAAMLDTAAAYLQKAVTVGKAVTGAAAAEATALANAAQVGIARVHLQNGRKAQASAAAALVPAGFTYNLLHLDDPNNRGRLGNDIWSYSESRISLVTGDEFRSIANCGAYFPSDTSCVKNQSGADAYRPKATGDPRISYTDMGRVAQDGILRFHRQGKITGWGSSDRLASKLEADYIQIEAEANPAAMLAFINARRAVGKQTALAATTDMTVLMKELMEQKTRDFWLEGKRMADFRRLGGAVIPYSLPDGGQYYKQGNIGNMKCWPVPGSEVRNNPNWPKS